MGLFGTSRKKNDSRGIVVTARSERRRVRREARPDAFNIDVARTITGNLKKFVSLAIITALGATMLVGLKAACDDLRFTADSYYDEQRLFDLSVKSTLGLDSADIKALSEVQGVEIAEGGYAETAYTQVDGTSQKVDLKALSPEGLNEPKVLEGRLPRDVHEIAVTQKYLDASGKSIGDTVTFESEGEDATAVFARGKYTITASVLDPMDVNAGTKTMSFRSSGGPQYAFFLTPGAVLARDTFTAAYITVTGAADLMTYSDEYKETVDGVKQRIEKTREQRELERTNRVKDDANEAIDAEQDKATEQLDEAADKLNDAQSEIASGRSQLDAAQGELAANERQVEQGLAQVAAGLGCSVDQIPAAMAAKQTQLDEANRQLIATRAQLQSTGDVMSRLPYVKDMWPSAAWARLMSATTPAEARSAADEFNTAIKPQLDSSIASLRELASYFHSDEFKQAYEQAKHDYDRLPPSVKERIERMLSDMPDGAEQAVRDLLAQPPDDMAAHADAMADQLEQLYGIADGVDALVEGEIKVREGQKSLVDTRAAYDKLIAAQAQLDSGESQIDANRRRLLAGQAELDESRAEFEEQKADAEAKFADARAEVDGIERATWYIQDRGSLASYASIESDASSIESIATVFPLIFFTVAVLISLTTVTRMVEEDRGLIGLYKALGYSRGRILSKYLIYSFSACLVGGIVGDALGFIALPEIIFSIFSTMYALPPFQLHFNAFTAVLGIVLFAVGIVGATFLSCRHVLKETPASLMRPKAPRAGKRILLEHITPLWRRMSFLNKVSARNLFRYKKRFLMTVFGIAGCTALMICGLGIRDTVISLKPRQYGPDGIVRYDLMAVTADADFARGEEELRATGAVDTMLEARVDSVTAEFGGAKESVQLIVVPNNADLSACIKTEDGAHTTFLAPAMGGEEISLPREGNGVLITKNVEQVLGFGLGDELKLQDSALQTGSVRVDGITVNFLGNFVFMTENAYRATFGEACVPNAFLVNLKGSDAKKIALADDLAAGNTFVSVSSSTKIANDFSESFKIIDVVVYVVTVMAAALAFAVVFTLSNTNISERERELATIKVLGFRRREVYRYINKETVILTLIGIVAGWPLGYFITRFLTYVLRMPSLFFDTIVEPQTYVFASLMSLVFTLIINKMTNRSLDKIDMVGALKSAE